METPTSTLFVAELPFDSQEADLATTFTAYEGFVSARIRKDKNNNTVGFVEFTDPNSALRAKDRAHGLKFGLGESKGLTVQFAYKQPHTRTVPPPSLTHSHLSRKQSGSPAPVNNSGSPNGNSGSPATNTGSPAANGTNSSGSPAQQSGSGNAPSPYSHPHSHSSLGTGHPVVYGNGMNKVNPSNSGNNNNTTNNTNNTHHQHHNNNNNSNNNNNNNNTRKAATATTIMQHQQPSNMMPELPAFYSSMPNSLSAYTFASNSHLLPSMIPGLPIDASATLYVEGLPLDATEREVAHIFRQWPGYQSLRILQKEGKQYPSRTYNLCFVEFDNKYQATMAMHHIQGYRFDKTDTKGITITYAKTERKDKRKMLLNTSTNSNTNTGNNNNNINTSSTTTNTANNTGSNNNNSNNSIVAGGAKE